MKNQITDPIATGSFRLPKNSKGYKTARIEIGRPCRDTKDPHADWYTPIFIEHYTSGVKKIFGVGSLDSLLNAMNLLNGFLSMNIVSYLEVEKEPKAQKELRVSQKC